MKFLEDGYWKIIWWQLQLYGYVKLNVCYGVVELESVFIEVFDDQFIEDNFGMVV